jgi:hypothetical protein
MIQFISDTAYIYLRINNVICCVRLHIIPYRYWWTGYYLEKDMLFLRRQHKATLFPGKCLTSPINSFNYKTYPDITYLCNNQEYPTICRVEYK